MPGFSDLGQRNGDAHWRYDLDYFDVERWQAAWRKFNHAHGLDGGESSHWNWPAKVLHIGLGGDFLVAGFVDEANDRCHGLMKLIFPKESRLVPGRATAYVDYLEIAPWNRWGSPAHVEHPGLGTAFMRQAARISRDLGFEGRLTLCSLPQSEMFYRRKISMIASGCGDGDDHMLTYFELEASAAERFIEEFE